MDEEQRVPGPWGEFLDDRQHKHVAFCRNYAKQFNHGAPGHLDYTLIALLADLLSDQANHIADLRRQIAGVKSVETET